MTSTEVTGEELMGEEAGHVGAIGSGVGLVRRHLPTMATELREEDRRMESEDIL